MVDFTIQYEQIGWMGAVSVTGFLCGSPYTVPPDKRNITRLQDEAFICSSITSSTLPGRNYMISLKSGSKAQTTKPV